MKFLEEEFRKEFKFHSNVHLTITFQKYDADWGSFVDLEENVSLPFKEKLKVVVSPVLASAPNSSVSDVSVVDPPTNDDPSVSDVSVVDLPMNDNHFTAAPSEVRGHIQTINIIVTLRPHPLPP
jgi:hypothetical protein